MSSSQILSEVTMGELTMQFMESSRELDSLRVAFSRTPSSELEIRILKTEAQGLRLKIEIQRKEMDWHVQTATAAMQKEIDYLLPAMHAEIALRVKLAEEVEDLKKELAYRRHVAEEARDLKRNVESMNEELTYRRKEAYRARGLIFIEKKRNQALIDKLFIAQRHRNAIAIAAGQSSST